MRINLTLLTILCLASFAAGWQSRHPAERVTERLVFVETQVPITLPLKRTAYNLRQQMILAAVLPERALRSGK